MSRPERPSVSRRRFLVGGAVAVGALAAGCGGGGGGGGDAAGTTTTGAPATTAATTPPTTSAPAVARFVSSGPPKPDRVALTFHTNGDLGLVDQLLDELDQHHAPITAFIVGDWLDANPDMAKRIAAGGHEFANHTYTHPTFQDLDHDQMLSEVTRCRDVLVRLTGGPGIAFRPSGTDDGTATPSPQVLSVAAEAGYAIVLGFDVDPLDYDDPGADVVVQRTLAVVHPGAIISLHFGHSGTVSAIPQILDGLQQRNLTPVTVSNLLA
jgi:peptidoglycan/xylan/chitin deacetylase (PgdA/CDA1 family)